MKSSIKKLVKQGIEVLKEPGKQFTLLQKKQLEDIVGHYLRLLLLLSMIAFLFNLIFVLGRTTYFIITSTIDINYLALFNYALTQSFAIAFSYIILGIFLVFFISIILRIFFKKIKYVELLKITLYSAHPLLLFSWTPYLIPSLLVWSVFLFYVGINIYKTDKILIGSIRQRY